MRSSDKPTGGFVATVVAPLIGPKAIASVGLGGEQ
jgi:hypothetical protein